MLENLQDDSFVVPDDEVDSSESITEESDFSVSDEESNYLDIYSTIKPTTYV